MFIHLNVKSNFSFGHGASSINELLEQAKQLNFDALALTDMNGMYAVIPFIKKAKEMDIKPIVGAVLDDPLAPHQRVILLPVNIYGFGELCRLITARKLDQNFSLTESLKTISSNLIMIGADVDLLKAGEHLKSVKRLYGEIVYHSPSNAPRCRALSAFCRQRKIPLVATNDVHFSQPGEYAKHKLLSAIFQNCALRQARFSASPQAFLRPASEMEKLYENMPDLVNSTRIIADQCEVDLELAKLKFPHYPLPEGIEPFQQLKYLTEIGFRKRYGEAPPRDTVSRLHYELGVIDRLGFTEYFLVVYDIKEKAVEWGMPFVGRGSAANSLVSYCLGFTEVDPIQHNLFFERFLNPYRKSPPDIDLDFSWKDRDRILQYVYNHYGDERVAMICTTVTFALRAAVRETAKVMGLAENEINRVTNRLPHFGADSPEQLRLTNPECANLPIEIEPWRTIFQQAQGMVRFPRHLSIHPGGIVIAPGKLTDYVPLERARKGFVVTQYDMYPIEDLGLVKIDLLSQRSLAVLTDAVSAVKRNYGITPPLDDFHTICADPETKNLIKTGATMGCFYIESPGMRALLKKLNCETFELLVAASSVIRPGVAESGMMQQFIERHHNHSKIEYLHPMMKELLRDTYGVMIYQEDVIKVANRIAGIPLGEADILRRAMSGKERSTRQMKAMRERFLNGCTANGISEAIAGEIWRQVESFAGYAFCKAHSASFALLSFKVAYMKANYPAEFISAVLSNQGGFYGPAAYIEEARRMGLKILLPDINLSEKEYGGRGHEISIGLQAILNLHQETMDKILCAREQKFFESLSDFLTRTDISVKETALLIKAGAFDFLGENRPTLLWKLETLKKSPALKSNNLFNLNDTVIDIPANIADYDPRQKFFLEKEIFGFPVTMHPLEFFSPELVDASNIIHADEIETYKGERVKMVGWAISHKRIKTRKTNEYMKFLSLEDLTGSFEVTLFPKTYKKFALKTLSKGPFLVEGRIEDDSGVLSLVADRLEVV